ncbi:MAG: transposase [Gammaproteobacteria bacterium]|nr:transposase [Gammaproteobacteria bacterium]
MSRRRRVHVPGGYYHVTLRGNHRQVIFRDSADRSALDAIVRGASERTGARVLAYCWMTNHIHLIAQVDGRPLGNFMQIIGSKYARYLQRSCGTTGHLFERRYHSVVVDRQDHLLHVVRYVHLNPVRAGLVATPGDYLWSSHRCYLGQMDLPWVHPASVLRLLASGLTEGRDAFAGFCGEAVSAPDCMIAARKILSAPPVPCSQPPRTPPRSGRSLDEIIVAVCSRAGVSEQVLAAPGKSHILSAARTEIAILATHEGVASLTDVARRFNRDVSSLARAATRRRRLQSSENVQMPNPVPL